MGLWDDFCDACEDVGEAVVDAVEDVGEAVVEVVETVVEAVEDVGEAVVEVVEVVGEAAVAVGEWGLNVLDDTVFDTVDFITGGAIDVDYDDGQFSAGVDLGFAEAGVSFGEQGFSANAGFDIGMASAGVAFDDDEGFSANFSAGLDWGPLPYAEGHIDVGFDGSVSIGGRAQGFLPTPVGIVGGEVEGEFNRNPDGSWNVGGAADGFLLTPNGTLITAGVHGAFEQEADGDQNWEVGGHAGIRTADGLHAEVGGEYSHTEQDGVTVDHVEGYANAGGYGAEVGVEGSYTHAQDEQGNEWEQTTLEGHASGMGIDAAAGMTSTTTTQGGHSETVTDKWADIDGLDADELMDLGAQALGEATGAGGDTVAGVVQDLAGAGDLGEVLGQLGDTGGDVGTAIDAVGAIVESGDLGEFASGIVSSELTEASADAVWDEIGG
jgi:hypothetical protein